MPGEKTIAREVCASGVGLHSGAPVRLSLRPAPEGSGITFFRSDLESAPPIPARIDFVGDDQLTTMLRRGNAAILTVEHLLAAAYGLEIDNLEVRVDGPELPSGDGSARFFVDLLTEAGEEQQNRERRIFPLSLPRSVESSGARIDTGPADEGDLMLECLIAYPQFQVPEQGFRVRLSPQSFRREIAPARTYGFLEDLAALEARGKGRGGSLANALVFSGGKAVNPEGLRFPEEPARHKLLDLIGDLALLGRRISGRITARYAGHSLHHRLVRELDQMLSPSRESS